MKRLLILHAVVFGLFLGVTAHPVDQETAKAIAVKFMGTNDLELSATYRTANGIATLYLFNARDGFVIVSADDCETPIIGYSHEGRFDPNNIPVQMEDYLQDFVSRIQYGIENHVVADEVTERQWELVKDKGRLNNDKTSQSVAPLITALWHQGCLYNSLCPAMQNTPCDHARAGCVAVAMGMIMRYWGYPASGWGANSYNNLGIQLSADFGNTAYDWGHMPDSLTESSSNAEIEAVATLLFHCGVSTDMQYSQDASLTDSREVPDALIKYFNYSRYLHLENKSKYNNEEWIALLKQCLDIQRPVYYSGNGDTGSHAFVCDGYDDNDLFHFNWGWGGQGNGYFAMGNLNPIGNVFNNKNYAIFDINPQYEPWMVSASVFPPMAGTVDGVGEYHVSESCTLTAIPAEGYEFYCWKKKGNISSYDTSISFIVNSDIDYYEANFKLLPVKEIAACYASGTNNTDDTCVSLTWQYEDTRWTLLKQFDITLNSQNGVATDDEYIYVSSYHGGDSYLPYMFEKYTMNGEFVERFDLDVPIYASNLVYDGNFFYCNNALDLGKLYCIDLANKTVVDSTELENVGILACAYEPTNDGFWLADTYNNRFVFINRQGQILSSGPLLYSFWIGGMGYITSKDGTPHLLLVHGGKVIDYDLSTNEQINIYGPTLVNYYSPWEYSLDGASIGKYDGKDALFICTQDYVLIYEIKNTLAQIMDYRLYRAREGGETIIIADEFVGNSYADTTWSCANAGVYRYGICSVFANGVESEIVWSNPIVKTNYDIEEHETPATSNVQKVYENGQIVIIKDGKRYNIKGQEIQ